MNILNTNTKISQIATFRELLCLFCILFLTASTFLGNTNFKSEKQPNSYSCKVNKDDTNKNFVQNSEPSRQANDLSEFDLIEESELTDESAEDDIVESTYSLFIPTSYICNISENSSANCSLYLHKRVFIPLFLLHHSLKIPFA